LVEGREGVQLHEVGRERERERESKVGAVARRLLNSGALLQRKRPRERERRRRRRRRGRSATGIGLLGLLW
jgi:hypothetical protein